MTKSKTGGAENEFCPGSVRAKASPDCLRRTAEVQPAMIDADTRLIFPSKPLLPNHALDVLWSCPTAGAGVHRWLFAAARVLHAHYADDNQIIGLLEAASADCGRSVQRREIEDAVRHSRQRTGLAGHASLTTTPTSAWPEPNRQKIEALIAAGMGLGGLKQASPHGWKDDANRAEEIADRLFPADALLCLGESNRQAATKTREEWRGQLAGQQFIVPSPMSGKFGRTKAGRPSSRTLENTGPRRFLVVEFDTGTPDQHATLLLHLASLAPLVLAVHSGGKSLHGWFYCAGQSEEVLRKFMRYAVSLGADPATWTRSQFVRLPDGVRDNGQRQVVLFFNLAAMGGAK